MMNKKVKNARDPLVSEAAAKKSLPPNPPIPQQQPRKTAPAEALKSPAPAAIPQAPPQRAVVPPKPSTPPPAVQTSPQKAAVGGKASMPAAPQTVSVAFRLHAPQAKQVLLCGDFNNWSLDATPMKRQYGGRWETTLPLPPGRYQYKFVADGEWVHDPSARQNVPNQYGSLNSSIEVGA